MRLQALCAILASFASVSVDAADLYEAPAPVFTPDSTQSSNWTGFYAGLHGGYGWAGDLSGVIAGDATTTSDDIFVETDVGGPVLGGQAGYNWQFDPVVLGIEGDASWSGIGPAEDNALFDEDVVEYLGSARLRAGVGLDRLHIYGTGGLGIAGINDTSQHESSDVNLGWAAGAGAEFLITDGVSLGGQYLHYGFDSDDERRSSKDRFDGSVGAFTGRLNVKVGAISP